MVRPSIQRIRQGVIDRLKSWASIGHCLRGGNRVSEITVGVGAGLWFDAGPSNPAYQSGSNELPVQRAFARYLMAGGVLYDVGANVGFLTVIGARLVGPQGMVYAFEPVPKNAKYVRRNARLNDHDNVAVIRKAVSHVSGKGELTLARYSGGAALSTVPAPPDAAGSLSIDLVAIDDLIFGEGLRRPTVVKIDVEGAELDVLQGMRRTLRECKPVVIYEIDDEKQDAFNRKQENCDTFLQHCGYQITRLENSYPDIRWIVGHTLATPS